MTLSYWLNKAKKEKWALPHFNIADSITFDAIIEAAKELKSPVMIGTSEGERKFLKLEEAVSLVKGYRINTGFPVFLNADHTKSVENAKKAIDAGYDSIHIDASEHPFEENIKMTKEVLLYARQKNLSISVEGELGFVAGQSTIHEKIELKKEDFTKPEEALKFVKETGVDRLAIMIGNFHGMTLEGKPAIDIELLSKINATLPTQTLVLHGGSGISQEDIKNAIKNGINNIHINTEVRLIFTNALKEELKTNPNETTPYKLFERPKEAMYNLIKQKIILFGAVGKI
jgi:fructose-bisphosphate aldolase class II